MIDWDDMVDLVALAGTYDQRKISELDVKAWFMSAQVEHWDGVPVVSRVIVEHYSRGADRPRISPAVISDRLRELRRKAADSFEDPKLPAELPDGQTYPQWYRDRMAEHVAQALAGWAATGQEPRPAAVEPMGNRLPEILAAAPDHLRPALEQAMTKTVRRQP